jgi:hypothetical protein
MFKNLKSLFLKKTITCLRAAGLFSLFKKIGAFTSVQVEALSTDQFAARSTSQIAAL